MLIKTPTSFKEAVGQADARELLPTDLSSEQLRRLEADIRQGSIFSARVTNARFLQAIKDVVEQVITGRINQAKAVEILSDVLDELGYTPRYGFAQPGELPEVPAEPGSLSDLSSEQRLRLIVDTQVQMALSRGMVMRAAADERSRRAWPAWEYLRFDPRDTPRGYVRRKGELIPRPADGWPARWARLGGKFYDGGRMIARIDDPIWQRLGNSSVFKDGLDNPYPPYAFASGYGLLRIPRLTAIRLGVIGVDDVPGPPAVGGPPLPPPPDVDSAIGGPLAQSIERDAPPSSQDPEQSANPTAPASPTGPGALTPEQLAKEAEWEAFLEEEFKRAEYPASAS